jgi:hypothetical protein
MTRQDFISFFAPIWSFRHDLEDGLTEELKEWRDELKDMDQEDDYTDLAQCVNESLENYGYPTMPLTREDA